MAQKAHLGMEDYQNRQSSLPIKINVNAVTATRYDVDVVVTEFGIARLQDASVSQKAARLIAVAHPDHRSELKEAAHRMGIL